MTQMVQSLFGINPEQLQAHRDQALWQQAQQFANLNPMERASAGAFMAGRQMVNGAAGLMGAQDPELQRIAMRQNLAKSIDWSNPEALKKAAQQAMQNGDYAAARELMDTADGMSAKALEAQVKASQIHKNMREAKGASVEEKAFLSLAAKASPQSVKAAIEAGNDISMLDVDPGEKISTYGRMLIESGLAQGSPEFKAKMTKYVQAELEGASKRGQTKVDITMPGSGTAKLSDINPTEGRISGELKPFKEKHTEVSAALELLNTDNPKAGAQVDRLLATMQGDKQLSMAEVEAVAKAGSLPQRVVDNFSKFFTGQSGQLSKDQKKEILELYQDVISNRHNATQQRLRKVYKTSELSPDQVDALIGDPLQGRKPGTSMTFSGDKEARYQEWKRKQLQGQ